MCVYVYVINNDVFVAVVIHCLSLSLLGGAYTPVKGERKKIKKKS